jgi:integrase
MDVPLALASTQREARMSVQRYDTADGVRWRVRWREPSGRMRSRTMTSKREASALDADVRARKFKGEILPRPGRESLAVAYDDWFRLHGSTLAPATQRTYRAVWDAHVRGRFDHHRLNELSADPQFFYELTADMRERGVGPAAQRKVLVVISAVLTLAVELKKIPTNPVWRMRKPPGTRQRIPRPFPPVVVERIRLRMARRETKDSSGARAAADACLVTLMSYAGLRPGEALALTWADIGSNTIAVDKAVRDGEEGPTKTGAVRSVPLVGPLQSDLDALRWTFGLPDNNRLVIPASDGGHWTRSELNNWRNRVWNPAVAWLADGDPTLASLATARPYDCRGSFVSLHLRAGASPLEVAKWAGHSPAVMFRHYANVIEELQGEPTISAEEQITRAREAVEEKQKEELDRLVVDLYEHPTVSGAVQLAGSGGPVGAARMLFAPNQ